MRLDEDLKEEKKIMYNTNLKYQVGSMNGALFKLKDICNFHLGNIITSLVKTSLGKNYTFSMDGEKIKTKNMIVYSTSMGQIGVFKPIENRDQIDFLNHLEMYLRLEYENISLRLHKAYRSLHIPVRCVFDGELLDEFKYIDDSKKLTIANDLSIEIKDVIRKLGQIKIFN